MLMREEQQRKTELVDQVAERAAAGADGRGDEVRLFSLQFYEHVSPDDVLGNVLGGRPDELVRAVRSLWELGQQRTPGVPKIRLSRPDPNGHTVIEIVNDDMPFLVDSLAAELHRQNAEILLVIHPIVTVRRDAEGRLTALLPPGQALDGGLRESFMHIRINAQLTAGPEAVESGILKVLEDVRASVEDFPRMKERCLAIAAELGENPPPLAAQEIGEGIAFLDWLAARNFTFLGYREYSFEGEGDAAVARVLTETGLGLLRHEPVQVFDGLRNLGTLPPDVRDFLRQPVLLRINKTNRASTVHKPVAMDSVAVKCFDKQGRVTGERLFVGLFTAAAYAASPLSIPLLQGKIQEVIHRAGFPPNSYDGKNLRHIIETYPRDELFQINGEELYRIALSILHLQERQRVAFFPRRDPFERFVSCLVFVPRDHYDTDMRLKLGAVLAAAYQGTVTYSQAHITESVLARVHIVVATKPGHIPAVDPDEVEASLAEVVRSWDDRLREALVARRGEPAGLALTRRYRHAFAASYQDRFGGEDAVFDIERIEEALASGGLALHLYRAPGAAPECLRFKVYGTPPAVPLSSILPMLENMGVKVVDENPYDVRLAADQPPLWIRDFSLVTEDGAPVDLDRVREAFHEAFERVWHDELENDGFNKLVLRAGLVAREVTILRACCKYLRQAQIPFSQRYMEETLGRNPKIARALVDLFLARFDPARTADSAPAAAALQAEIANLLDAVSNLDEDRILRRFLNLIEASLRTNFFQKGADGKAKSYLAIKLDSQAIEELPLPRPFREIFVYSPRFEAVHLRGGRVARGGIRWSDRREDFRTEVLGLMKAQMVKNAVIVPVGSKGGFVLKREVARDKRQEEGVECYKQMMRGLLDVTDNYRGMEIVPPPDVVRHDDDDPYLVVAADKGTATFSDIANGISVEYGFWLDDAFASGGSAGYDHKQMAITSRGAWESVKRHFREIGKDIQTTDFSVMGIGDMSGDVFGNGMLMSKHIRLLAAFDHRHIFLDPDPDPARSWVERKRLFDKSRSSWADYDASLISAGGGVFDRSVKSIPLSAEVKGLLGLTQDEVSPPALMNAILRADVELLFFGGIGTYVKASTETHVDASDRANDLIRIDAAQIRARVLGEGANLGVTQRARIEYGLRGGRLNTDFIDNSAGVDCSDHEVNIKILLGDAEQNAGLSREKRDQVLSTMTDEVGHLVLRDNYLQTQAISVTHPLGAHLLDRMARLMRQLEKEGPLNRRIEFLPDEEALTERMRLRQGFTRPELAVLLSYAKMTIYDQILGSDLPDDAYMQEDLKLYFPTLLREQYGEQIGRHRLRREIIATAVTNSMVNRVGPAFLHEIKDRTGMASADVARAYVITRDVFGLRALWGAIEGLDNQVAAEVQYKMLLECGRATERGVSWFLGQHGAIDITAQIDAYGPGLRGLHDSLDDLLADTDLKLRSERAAGLSDAGVPADMAVRVASLPWLAPLCDIMRIARATGVSAAQVGRVYFVIGARFGFDWLRMAAGRISTDKSWNKLAVSAIVDDLFGQQAELTSRVLSAAEKGAAESSLDAWIDARRPLVARAEQLLAELRTVGEPDLAMLAVANRALKSIGA
jgi:glutamate dehydrogenase